CAMVHSSDVGPPGCLGGGPTAASVERTFYKPSPWPWSRTATSGSGPARDEFLPTEKLQPVCRRSLLGTSTKERGSAGPRRGRSRGPGPRGFVGTSPLRGPAHHHPDVVAPARRRPERPRGARAGARGCGGLTPQVPQGRPPSPPLDRDPRPGGRDAGIDLEEGAPPPQPQDLFGRNAIHPARGPRVPRPAPAPGLVGLRPHVPRHHVGLHLVDLRTGRGPAVVDRVQHVEELDGLVAVPQARQ